MRPRSHARPPPAAPLLALLLAALLAGPLAGCAALPPPVYPDHLDAAVAVRCIVPASGRLQVPASAPDLVVRDLHAEPAPRGEAFGVRGERWLLYDGGTEVTLRGRLRLYRDGVGASLDPRDRRALFPDAVEWLDPR